LAVSCCSGKAVAKHSGVIAPVVSSNDSVCAQKTLQAISHRCFATGDLAALLCTVVIRRFTNSSEQILDVALLPSALA
jgi:hypothetical protein